MNLLILYGDLVLCIVLTACYFVAVRNGWRAKLCNYGQFTQVMGVHALQRFLKFYGIGRVYELLVAVLGEELVLVEGFQLLIALCFIIIHEIDMA